MNARHVNFAALERGKGDAAAHQTRHQVFLIVFSHMLAGQKHRRVATANNNLAAHRLAILEQSDFNPVVVGIGPDNQAVGVSAQAT